MALPQIFEILERSIYEAVRVITFAEGYTPDITAYPNNPLSYEQYQAALKSIQVAKGFAIEIFNNSAPEQKGMIETSRISIVHGGTPMGDIGLPVQKDDNNYGQTFGRVVGTTLTNEYLYEVFITSRNLKEFRVCQGIVQQALNSRGWINIINEPGERFLNIMTSGYSSPGELRGVKEFIYSYRIPDVLTSLYTETDVIPAMQQYDLEISKHLGLI